MPKLRLTKRTVDAFSCPPGEARACLFDTDLVGFHLEALRSGRKVYRYKWKRDGKQGRETLGEHGVITVEQARARATTLRGKTFDGETPAQTKAIRAEERMRSLPLTEVVEKWLAEGAAAAPNKRESSWKTDARKLRLHITPLLGSKSARDITKSDIEDAQRQIAEGRTARNVINANGQRSNVRGGEGVARSAIMSLSACYSWAIDRGIVDDNPCLRVKKPKPRKLERFLSRDEAMRLFAVLDTMETTGELDDMFADMTRLLLLTGARKSEIQDLEWSEVDFERRLIRLPRNRSKTGEKAIPLNAEALQILKSRRERTASTDAKGARPYVFPSRLADGVAKGLQKAWERVRKRAELDNVRLHDLRHSFASFAAASGASLFLIGKALGHTQTQTTERYAHLRDDPLHAVAASVGNLLSRTPSES